MIQYIQKLNNILEMFENLIEIYNSNTIPQITENDLLKIKNTINFNKENALDKQENIFWKQCIGFFNKPLNINTIYHLISVIKIQDSYLRLYHDLKTNKDLYFKDIEQADGVEWFQYFWDDIMSDYFSLLGNFNYHDTFHYDNVIRGMRSIDEKLTFWVFVLINGKEKWNKEMIIDMYDYNLNISRLELCQKQDASTTYILNDEVLNKASYMKSLKNKNSELETKYFNNLISISENAIYEIKSQYRLTDIQIDEFRQNLGKKKINILFDKFELIDKKLGLKSEEEEKMRIDLYNKFSCLKKIDKFPRNIYEYVNNILTAEGNTHGLNLRAISNFRKYVDTITNHKVLLQLGSSIEYNQSNHIQFDNMIFNSSEISIFINKILPIKIFQTELEDKYEIYIRMLMIEFQGEDVYVQIQNRWRQQHITLNKQVSDCKSYN